MIYDAATDATSVNVFDGDRISAGPVAVRKASRQRLRTSTLHAVWPVDVLHVRRHGCTVTSAGEYGHRIEGGRRLAATPRHIRTRGTEGPYLRCATSSSRA